MLSLSRAESTAEPPAPADIKTARCTSCVCLLEMANISVPAAANDIERCVFGVADEYGLFSRVAGAMCVRDEQLRQL